MRLRPLPGRSWVAWDLVGGESGWAGVELKGSTTRTNIRGTNDATAAADIAASSGTPH